MSQIKGLAAAGPPEAHASEHHISPSNQEGIVQSLQDAARDAALWGGS